MWDTQCAPPGGIFALLRLVPLVRGPSRCRSRPDVTSQETVGACSLKLTHEAFESITPHGLVSPTYCFRDNTRILSSAGMTFLLEQSLENEVGSMLLEEVLPLSSSGADAPAPVVSERVQALERRKSENGRCGGRGGGSREPRRRSGTESLDGVQSQILADVRALRRFHLFEQWSCRWRQPLPLWVRGLSLHRPSTPSRFGVDAGSHRRRSGETSVTLNQRCFWPSGRPCRKSRRTRRSPRRRTQRLSQRGGQAERRLSSRRSSKPGNVGRMWCWRVTRVV